MPYDFVLFYNQTACTSVLEAHFFAVMITYGTFAGLALCIGPPLALGRKKSCINNHPQCNSGYTNYKKDEERPDIYSQYKQRNGKQDCRNCDQYKPALRKIHVIAPLPLYGNTLADVTLHTLLFPSCLSFFRLFLS